MSSCGVFLPALSYHRIQRDTVVCLCIRFFVLHKCVTWNILIYPCCIRQCRCLCWYTVVYARMPWYTIVYGRILSYTIVYGRILSHTIFIFKQMFHVEHFCFHDRTAKDRVAPDVSRNQLTATASAVLPPLISGAAIFYADSLSVCTSFAYALDFEYCRAHLVRSLLFY